MEGGTSCYSLKELAQGSYNAQADDLKYWQIVFTAFAGERTFHFRAVGSKTTIRELAGLILGGQVKHVLIVMDRAFDHITGSLPTGPGVLSTSGYSWENDVWTSPVVFAAFRKFNTSPEVEPQAMTLIEQEFARVNSKLRCCVRADAILSFNNLEPLPRDKLKKIVRPVRGGAPTIALPFAKSLVRTRRLKTRPRRLFGPKVKLTTLADAYGHLLQAFGYHLLVYVLSKFSGIKTTPRQLLVPVAIDAFAVQLQADPALKLHYSTLFGSIKWGH